MRRDASEDVRTPAPAHGFGPRLCVAWAALSIAALGLGGARLAPARADAAAAEAARSSATTVAGLDHVPVAVRDLEAAAARFERLGFVLKPGRLHANGLRNRHAKFPDGTEIELITASEAGDALTTEYVAHLAGGDGPAFLALFAPDRDRLARELRAAGLRPRASDGLLFFDAGDPLRYLFFGARGASPTDRPEHFRHPNGADALVAAWLSADDLSAERRLLATVGATFAEEEVHAPAATRATVARLPYGEVLLLAGPARAGGRRIAGVTVRTRSLAAARAVLAARGGPPVAVVRTPRGASVFLPPGETAGLWIELREERERRP